MNEATAVAEPSFAVRTTIAPASTAWHPSKRCAFRFAFVYFLLYASERLCAIVGQLAIMVVRLFVSDDWMTAHPAVVETLLKPNTWCRQGWDVAVRWTGEHVTWLHANVTAAPLGSGDTTWNWVHIFLAAVGALAGSVLWTAIAEPLGFRRHAKIRVVAFVMCRYLVAAYMMSYGFLKVLSHQFSEPSLVQLTGRYGDFSPMGLLWRTLGFSPTYEVFAGAGEALSGVLLCFRRTTTLGALVGIAVMTNVVMMNFCFDVPVKIFSSHLLLFLGVIALPDARRLLDVLVLHRPPAPSRLAAHSWSRAIVELVVMAAFIWMNSDGKVQALLARDPPEAPMPLAGVWDVVELTRDGASVPPLTTDASRWRQVVIESQFGSKRFVARTMDEKLTWFGIEIDATAHSIQLTPRVKDPQAVTLAYSQPAENELALTGPLDGHATTMRLVRRDPKEFLLTNRGFHWVNEFPMNR